jgi:hypothetical protein
MSIRAWGNCLLNDAISYIDEEGIVFQIQQLALDNHIGIVFGSNISNLGNELRVEYVDHAHVVLFKLVDNPKTIVAEVLFSGDGVKISQIGQRVDIGESLISRLSRIHSFFLKMSNISMIEETTFHLIGDTENNGDAVPIEISVYDMQLCLTKKYASKKGWVPSINIIIKNNKHGLLCWKAGLILKVKPATFNYRYILIK